jgi:hypothetical protein
LLFSILIIVLSIILLTTVFMTEKEID